MRYLSHPGRDVVHAGIPQFVLRLVRDSGDRRPVCIAEVVVGVTGRGPSGLEPDQVHRGRCRATGFSLTGDVKFHIVRAGAAARGAAGDSRGHWAFGRNYGK